MHSDYDSERFTRPPSPLCDVRSPVKQDAAAGATVKEVLPGPAIVAGASISTAIFESQEDPPFHKGRHPQGGGEGATHGSASFASSAPHQTHGSASFASSAPHQTVEIHVGESGTRTLIPFEQITLVWRNLQ